MAHDETYVLDDGTETNNRSEYIRQEFKKDKSRNEIAEELDVSYNIVYTATANMENATTQGSRKKLIEGELAEKLGVEEGTPRNDYIREQIEAGRTRSEVADELGTTYNIVYAASSDLEAAGTRGRTPLIEGELAEELGVKDGTPRKDYIRGEYAAGRSRREIADELGIDYSAAWRATKDMPDPNADDEAEDTDEDNEAEVNEDGVVIEEEDDEEEE